MDQKENFKDQKTQEKWIHSSIEEKMKKNISWNFFYKKMMDPVLLKWLDKSAWWGHHFFVYDLVRNSKPKVIVELGSHWGFSFFTFCEAVKDEKIKTKIHAIDSWEGDSQAGYYGEEVFNFFNSILKKKYKSLDIHVHRGYFDTFLSDFKESSIDLLHIDGLHTYQAVKKDFDNWLPKMTENGIMLFHDISVYKNDFGVWKLWAELKKEYDTIEFSHSHGLGVLFLGKNNLIDESDIYYYQRCYEDALINMIKDINQKYHRLKNNISELKKINNKQLKEIDKLNKIIFTIRKSRLWKIRNKITKIIGRG